MDNSEKTVAPVIRCRILSIDAWRYDDGWQWNNWFNVGIFEGSEALLDNARALLKYMRQENYLSSYSAGKVALDDDGYNVVIINKDTREPIFAIEYGSNLEGNDNG